MQNSQNKPSDAGGQQTRSLELNAVNNRVAAPPLDFVYLYIAKGARGDELRFSIRSVVQNYLGAARIWIVGDCPEWYSGLHLPIKRVPRTAGWPRIDRAHKFYQIATGNNEIAQRFIAMQDDIYFLNPVTLDDLAKRWVNDKPLTEEKIRNWKPKHAYLKQKKRTAERLIEQGVQYVCDYSTHTPKLYKKSELRRVIERYDALRTPLVCTILFDNATKRTDSPFPIQPFRVRLKSKDHTAQELLQQCQGKIFLNHLDQSWTSETRKALEVLFPNKSPVEK